MRFTDIFVRRPVLATVVSLLILLIGLRAFFTLPIRQYPELKNTVITVTTQYPGASAELMQGFITVPIAQAVAGAEGVEYLTSNSQQGASTVMAYIRLNFDPNKAMTDVLAKVNQVRYLLPRESNDPVISKTTGNTLAVMYMGFGSHDMPGPAITDYLTRVVQPLLATVPGVASAEILGGQPFAMRVWLDPTRMAARGVSAEDVRAAIQTNNYQSAAGQAKGYFTVTNITADTSLASIDDFKAMVVKAENGALVRLSDIATVELGAKSSDSSVQMNGQHAVFIGINATPDGNPLEIVKGVRELVPTLERGLPPGLVMEIPYDSTEFINAAIHEVQMTLGEAVLIVIVVIFLFLGSFRSVLIPVVTIPLSIIGAGTLMLALGFSLNLLTLLAMVLAIGLVVDDAIVVVENVYRHIEEGKTPVQAALIGAREIAGPVVTMTLTLAAVYAPIGFLSGLTGSLFREFAFTLAGSVIISGVVALTLSPMMCAYVLTSQSQHGRFARLVDRTFSATTRWYGRRLHGTLEYRPVTAFFAVAVLASLPFLFLNSNAELAPEEDQGVLFGVTKGPQNANIDYMDAYGEKVDEVFSSFPETVFRFIVAGMDGGPRNGFAGMALKPWDQRERTAKEIQPEVQGALQQNVTGLQAFVFSLPPLPSNSQGLPIQMVISSPSGFEIGLPGDGGAEGRGPQERHVHRHRQRPPVRQPGDEGRDRPRQGQRPGRQHGDDRQRAGDPAGRQLRQPLQPRGPLLRGDPAGAARAAPEPGAHHPALYRDPQRRADPALHRGAHRHRHRAQRADPVQPAQLGHLLGRGDAHRHHGPGGGLPARPGSGNPAGRLPLRLPLGIPAVREGGQPAHLHLRLRHGDHLPGARGPVRILARPVRDPDLGADVDLRCADPALLRRLHPQHLHPDRPRHADRPDQQARHLDGGVRQRAAARGQSRPPCRHRGGGQGPPAPDPDDHGRHGGGPRCRC